MNIKDFSRRAIKKTQDGWADRLKPVGFTHLLTLPFAQAEDFSTYRNDRSAVWKAPRRAEMVERCLKNLAHKIFGRRARKSLRLHFFGFAEVLSRFGFPVPFHFHVLIKILPGYEGKFNKYVESEWRKIVGQEYGPHNRVAAPDVKEIYDLDGIIDYISKHSDSELQFIFDLPEPQI